MATVQFRPIGVTAQTIHALVKAKETDALALYMAYFEVSDWQKCQRVKATTGFMATRLGWSESKIQKNKKVLIEMGLIADYKDVDPVTNQVNGWYIAIYHLVDKTIQHDAHPSQIPGGGLGQGVENLGISAINVKESAINVSKVGISKEIQITTKNEEDNTEFSGNSKTAAQVALENGDYDVVPTNLDGDEISPRKKPQTWDVEKRVFAAFVDKAKVYTGIEPEPAKLWQLKQIRQVLPNYTKNEILEIFDDWFSEAPDDKILSVHAALSAHNLNKYKMKK